MTSIVRWDNRTKLLLAIGAISAYFLTASWLRSQYSQPAISRTEPRVAGEKVLLRRPFVRFLSSEFGVIARDETFASLADSPDNNERSPIEIYEDGRPIGPPHSVHADVARIGRGRYSHWRNKVSIFIFSSSDNSDPQSNGRAYWAVKPTP
ncbi:hypothetical protein [Bradyrhizobium sp. RDI18]|uniref:hypothetical protein n=1 Tax=Bradyrhizobium sp. RDI18 TaxID=3367400 RepID=UPI0037172823